MTPFDFPTNILNRGIKCTVIGYLTSEIHVLWGPFPILTSHYELIKVKCSYSAIQYEIVGNQYETFGDISRNLKIQWKLYRLFIF